MKENRINFFEFEKKTHLKKWVLRIISRFPTASHPTLYKLFYRTTFTWKSARDHPSYSYIFFKNRIQMDNTVVENGNVTFRFQEGKAISKVLRDSLSSVFPRDPRDPTDPREYVVPHDDVILFSESTVHGAMPWTQETQRRLCSYRFPPATQAYGRSYLSYKEGCAWPKKMYENLSPAQRAVLETPYANRLDRHEIQENGSTETFSRNAKKTEHDLALFGTKYF